jgi:site-specific recombinase XerD
MTADLAQAMEQLRQASPNATICFQTAQGGRWQPNNPQRVLTRLCKKAGVKRITWHALRHTFCTHLIIRGASVPVVKELAGHSDVRITMQYVHLTDDAKRKAIAMLSRGSVRTDSEESRFEG